MARLAISKDYFPAYASLPRKAQRKADEFLRKFEQDSTATAIHLEPIKRAVDRQLRSARIGDDYRMILRAPEEGDIFLVLWADHHDEAYRWAATKQTAVHPATGSLQIFDVTEATEAVTTAPEEVAAAWAAPASEPVPAQEPSAATPATLAIDESDGLFSAHSDDDIFIAGVPRALLPSVRALASDAELDRLLPYLPPEAAEVLTALAAGIGLDEALEEVLGRPAQPAVALALPAIDITDVPAALERETTQRQFKLVDEGLDLDAALRHPLDVWRVFLHPRQRRLAYARTKGPTRVLGGAGTGKTVVALHRAAFLVREVFTKPDDKVLFTTFTVNLAQDLRTQLAKLLEPDALARVEVVNIDAWASTYLRQRGVAVRPAFEKEQKPHFDAAYEVYGQDGVPADFYRAEWRDVIQEQGLQTEDEYVGAVRKSRGVPLGRADRRRLWPVFAAYRDNLEHAGLLEPLDILRKARAELEVAGGEPRYRSVVVDEVQDFSADALKLLRAIAGPERPDDLFLVGDAHQRIYGRPVALSRCGIQVRGRRSQTLRVNYRTTGAICRFALGVLKDVSVDDLDDGLADRRGHVSLREGPSPRIHACTSNADEAAAVVAAVKAAIEAGTAAESICIVARTHGPLRDRFAPALERAGLTCVVLEQEEPRLPGVRLATMHRVKGLEFAIVMLVNITKHDLPLSTPELRSDDAILSAQALLRERSLFYVAASRARDELHVFYAGQPSELLTPLAGRAVSADGESQADKAQPSARPPRRSTRPPSPPVAPPTEREA
ncbi:MAG: DEAD/DEAH box helicase, partial [Myxococcales bacterium]|nr:DEAD/DEAH box helicase [Myxococcales bacterium]